MRLWFAGLITCCEALTLAGVYVSVHQHRRAPCSGCSVPPAASMMSMAPNSPAGSATMHPEVPAALRRLRDHGFRLFTLTDNTLEIFGRQLDAACVTHLFERRFSVDETVRPAQDGAGGLPLGGRRAQGRSRRHLPDR